MSRSDGDNMQPWRIPLQPTSGLKILTFARCPLH